MNTSFRESRRRCIAGLLAIFFLPLIVNLAASPLLKLLPLGETALRFNAAYQGCLFLAALAWYRQGGKSGVWEERPFPWRDFVGTFCLYLLLILLLDRSSFTMSDWLYRSSAGAFRNLGGQMVWVTLVVYALCGAVAEELLFCGASERGLVAFFGRPWQLTCGSTFLLAFYHGNSTQGLPAFPLELVFSWLKARGGLRASVAAYLSTNPLALRL